MINMKESYDNINEFLDDIHDQISSRDTVVSMGIIEEN